MTGSDDSYSVMLCISFCNFISRGFFDWWHSLRRLSYYVFDFASPLHSQNNPTESRATGREDPNQGSSKDP